MNAQADPRKPWYLQWLLSKRATIGVLTALGLLLLVFQINKMLSSSFRLEVFGVEILEVQHLDEADAGEEEEVPVVVRRPRMAPVPPVPPLPPLPARPPAVVVAPGEGDVFVVVEEMPRLIGGLQQIQRQIRYPEIAKRAGIEGRVILQFIVDEQGEVQDAQVVRGIGGGCDEEARRVVKQARFHPGKQRGEVVKVKLSLPVTFRLAQQ